MICIAKLCSAVSLIMKILVIYINLMIVLLSNAKETFHLGVHTDLIGFLPAMELALETIEKDETLPFTLDVTLNHSMVSIVSYIRMNKKAYS